MRNRKVIPKTTITDVLCQSRRRCCVCFGLKRDTNPKKGQIAHLDQNASNSAPENLVWLCMEHHDEYDSRTSQSKGLTLGEIKRYREELHLGIERQFTVMQVIEQEESTGFLWSSNISDIVREALGSKVMDKMIEYKGHRPFIGLCRLRIYKIGRQKPVVIVTQFPDNPGTSITNVAESLATHVYTTELKSPPEGMLWIEHYSALGHPKPEIYSQVSFRHECGEFTDPEWSELTAEEVKFLVRQIEI